MEKWANSCVPNWNKQADDAQETVQRKWEKHKVSGQMAFHQNVKEGNQATTSCRIQN